MNAVFTVGQVSKMCNVAARTVAKWVDAGALKGYRLPGSLDRRIPRESLKLFMAEHRMPFPAELEEPPKAAPVINFNERSISDSVANLKRFADGEVHDGNCLQHDCRAVATSYETIAIGVARTAGVSIL